MESFISASTKLKILYRCRGYYSSFATMFSETTYFIGGNYESANRISSYRTRFAIGVHNNGDDIDTIWKEKKEKKREKIKSLL